MWIVGRVYNAGSDNFNSKHENLLMNSYVHVAIRIVYITLANYSYLVASYCLKIKIINYFDKIAYSCNTHYISHTAINTLTTHYHRLM